MRYMDRCISLLILAAAIAAPTAIKASPKPQEGTVRVYDRDHRDYHDWNDHEDRAYRRYLAEQHRSYRTYQRQHYRAQRRYWNWRHSHPDRD